MIPFVVVIWYRVEITHLVFPSICGNSGRTGSLRAAFPYYEMTEQERQNFYRSQKWKIFRERVLRRDDYTCQRCKRYGRVTPAREVHHIKHLEDYPELAFAPDNCISLCKICHNMQHPEKGTNSIRNYNRMDRY